MFVIYKKNGRRRAIQIIVFPDSLEHRNTGNDIIGSSHNLYKIHMTEKDFLDILKARKFPKPILVEQPPNGHLDLHRHEFEVYALVLEGSINIELEGKTSSYKCGDIFHLDFQQAHKETYSNIGVKYLASRKTT